MLLASCCCSQCTIEKIDLGRGGLWRSSLTGANRSKVKPLLSLSLSLSFFFAFFVGYETMCLMSRNAHRRSTKSSSSNHPKRRFRLNNSTRSAAVAASLVFATAPGAVLAAANTNQIIRWNALQVRLTTALFGTTAGSLADGGCVLVPCEEPTHCARKRSFERVDAAGGSDNVLNVHEYEVPSLWELCLSPISFLTSRGVITSIIWCCDVFDT